MKTIKINWIVLLSKRIVSKVKFEINRIINKRHAYDYPESNDGWKKENIPIIHDSSETYYDPYFYYFKGIANLLISNRDRRCIYRYKSLNGWNWSDRECVIQSPNNRKWNSRINRLCACVKDETVHLWFTGQLEKNSYIGKGYINDRAEFILNSNPVLAPEFKFEGFSVMNPCVLWDNENSIYKMWYSAGEQYEPDVICYAISSDGINWTKYSQPVLTKSNNEYDKYKVGGCDVHKTQEGYVMYYIGYQNLDNARICKAFSHDGVSWTRSKINPIISPSKNGWDCDACYKPAFYYSESLNTSFIYYNGRRGHYETIGMAYKYGNDLLSSS